jgi:uncharacterized protein (DUF1697 family)
MNKYIAILRGINVSGHNIIKMKDLQAMFAGIGFKNVATYIQSGNVVFESKPAANSQLAGRISTEISASFAYSVPVIVITAVELKTVAGNNPFIIQRSEDESKLHVTFLAGEPGTELKNSIHRDEYIPEKFSFGHHAVYLFCPNGYGNARLNNNFFEKRLKVQATTRNWKTILALAALTEK